MLKTIGIVIFCISGILLMVGCEYLFHEFGIYSDFVIRFFEISIVFIMTGVLSILHSIEEKD